MFFTKMNGAGNDYIYFDLLNDKTTDKTFTKEAIIRLCDRNKSIGGDGIVLINKSNVAIAKMIIFNSDGSRAEMCGNALRCVARYLYDNKYISNKRFFIETDSGIKDTVINDDESVTVCLGKPLSDYIPLKPLKDNSIFGYELNIGNPHFVVFSPKIDKDFEKTAKTISNNKEIFPFGVNVEFAEIDTDYNSAKIRVYERGSGETLSGGTGASAVFEIASYLGLLRDDAKMILKGGILKCAHNSNGEILLTGNAELNFKGEISI